MPEGTIKFVVPLKGFGFILSEDETHEYFFHRNNVAQGCTFDALQQGSAVTFQVRASRIKPGQDEAYEVRASPRSLSGTPRPAHEAPRVNVRRPPAGPATLPYGFIPIDLTHTVTDTPVWHDGSCGGALLCGEILCELEALTPFLPGNARYTAELADPARLAQWGFATLGKGKQIAEPLRLPDGRVVIPGTALKGMTRQSLGALTSAPMERVAERHFSYRPNLDFNAKGTEERYVVRPARVRSEKDGGWQIEVFDDPQAALFVRREIEDVIRRASTNGVIQGSVAGVDVEVKQRPGKPARKTNHLIRSHGAMRFSHRMATYKGGIDGEGLLAAAFNQSRPNTYRLALIPQQADVTLHLPEALYQCYQRHQDTVLANSTTGHLKAHPLDIDPERVAASIKAHRDFEPGQLIYVELTTNARGHVSAESKVVSCGHHFRYRWAYTSSVRYQGGSLRECLTPHPDELTPNGAADRAPERLTGARLLFGYVHDRETNPIGKGVFERLAGRIAINHAVSVGVPAFLGDAARGDCVPLKILGQPKPSAWECYLQQPKNRLVTYGDLPDDPGGALAGRKIYRHQKDTSQQDIEGSDSDVDSDQATLARFICAPGTRFRFTIRFARLRPWELGAVLTVLEPHHLGVSGKPDEYAHKLGLGRPLGMGSVRITRQGIRVRQEQDTAFLDANATDQRVSEAIQALQKTLKPEAVAAWLHAHRMGDHTRLGYPLGQAMKDRKPIQAIYAWHTDLHREYSKVRRQTTPDWSSLSNRVSKVKE